MDFDFDIVLLYDAIYSDRLWSPSAQCVNKQVAGFASVASASWWRAARQPGQKASSTVDGIFTVSRVLSPAIVTSSTLKTALHARPAHRLQNLNACATPVRADDSHAIMTDPR